MPLDYRDPDGPTLPLALIRRPATSPAIRIGSLIVNPGGPGASGYAFVRRAGLAGSLNERFDIVGFDPRGVGRSRGLSCSHQGVVQEFRATDSDPDTQEEELALDAVSERVADACGADADLLPNMHTDFVARDVEQIRQAVGDPKLTYLGFSYGTAIGLRYVELFPTNVRAMVLDGVVDPTLDLEQLLTAQAEAIETALSAIFARCVGDPACPTKEPEGLYDRVSTQLETSPIDAGTAMIGPAELTLAAISATYDRSLGNQFVQSLELA
ncbi:MAG: alpha/beta hydrolase, partial [Acidimicrobiales bacterium]|nr:alpha/beta hydrolase [Acidimicrobiales bacterium]